VGRPTKKWMEENTAWRLAALDIIKSWLAGRRQPFDETTRRVVVKHFSKLEGLVDFLYPDHAPAPFAPEDAAALIVAPWRQAERLARALFDERWDPEWTGSFNLDWFHPPAY